MMVIFVVCMSFFNVILIIKESVHQASLVIVKYYRLTLFKCCGIRQE